MSIKFNSIGSTFSNVGTFLSAATGSKLRVFMQCKSCHMHSELPQNGAVKCPNCGSTESERIAISEEMPEWFVTSKASG